MINISIDNEQISRFAQYLVNHAEDIKPFDFCTSSEGNIFPERDAPGVLDYFFFCCAHQFGFWTMDEGRWMAPMVNPIDGVELKGSEFLWRAATRALQNDPSVFSPAVLAAGSEEQIGAVFHDDNGINPLPMWEEHLDIFRRYGKWFVDNDVTPEGLLENANSDTRPLRSFLRELLVVPGYKEDILQKKALLLSIALENRPEHFLKVTDPHAYRPIIDYHLLRSALRTGLIKIENAALQTRIEARMEVSAEEEDAIRSATYRAVDMLTVQTRFSVAAIDYFFFKSRIGCPEVTPPKCEECPVEDICAKRIDLFQPVFRTTFY